MDTAILKKRSIQAAIDENRFTPRDAELIILFVTDLRAMKGISKARVNKLLFTLVSWRRFIDTPYDKCTAADLTRAIPLLREGTSARQKPFKSNTISDFLKILKQFYTWMIRRGYSSIKQADVDNIKAPARDAMVHTVEDILTEDEVKSLIQTAKRDFDRAFIAVHYEGGFRFGELSLLQWHQVKFDEYGAQINTNLKTGIARYVRLVMSTEYLARWKSVSQAKPNDLVFPNIHGRSLTHAAATIQINRLAERTGIKKRITPHLLRYSRITHLLQQGMQESVIKTMMWGSPKSRQLATYMRMTGREVDDEVLKTNGIKRKERKEHALRALQCPTCSTIYSSTSDTCPRCGRNYDEKDEVTLLREKIRQMEVEREEWEKRFTRDIEEKMMNIVKLYNPELISRR